MPRMQITPQMQMQLQQQMKNFNPAVALAQIESNPQLMNNPRVRNVIELRNNHDTEGLNAMATNIFKENGKDFSDFTNNVKQQMGFI